MSVATERFHQLLQERREALLSVSATANQAAGTVKLDQTCVGRLSRMDALRSQAMSVESNRRRNLELKRIAAALSRINEGEYGYCLSCGEEIAEKRLEVDPAAPFCIICADKAEGMPGV
ncbi:MAG: TraR/DksA C4-type zinc finger protein [Sedimenticola sp.]